MCRDIKILRAPYAASVSDQDVQAAAVQYVQTVSGFRRPVPADAEAFDRHHYAFHVDDAEFDAILGRVQAAGIPYGSDPWHTENKELNNWRGGRGVYFRDPNGHLLELLTRT